MTHTDRTAARVIVLDERGHVLLLRGLDPTRPERGSWWFTPGGGIDAGESAADAARRELAEETGLRIDELGPVRFERHATFEFEGVTYQQHERYFVVRTARFDPTRDGWTEVERRSVLEHRWWSVEELATTNDVIYPEQLVQRLRNLLGLSGPSEVTDVRNRSAGAQDFAFLATMLGEAAVWRPDKPTPTGDQVLADPKYAMYLAGWPREGDDGLVAEHDGPVGAAWYRRFTDATHGHGYVAEDVPELAIAVIASRRHEGIGRRLLTDLIDASVAQGHPALSLTVSEANPARDLYQSVGFVDVEKHGWSWTMIRHAARST